MTVFEKIEAQQKGKEDTPVWMVGEQLKDICRNDPHCAELVLHDLDIAEMSIEKAERKLKEYADKQKRTGNCVCVPPNVAERILRDFCGLPAAEAQVQPNPSVADSGELPSLDLLSFL